MRSVSPAWKSLIAFISLLLAVLIWGKGLEQSFDRPSVLPVLSLQQKEIALLAKPSVPNALKPALVGEDPQFALREALRKIPFDLLDERKRLLLASLEPSEEKRNEILTDPFTSETLSVVQEVLLGSPDEAQTSWQYLGEKKQLKNDPLLNQLICNAIGNQDDKCINRMVSRTMALRLGLSQGFPIAALLLGIILLLRKLWGFLRAENYVWPELVALPLSLVDMVIFIAGGFVVLGEVVSPIFFSPISAALTKGLESPLKDSINVFVGYIAMALPPLLILRNQINDLPSLSKSVEGWMQWRIKPVGSAVRNALSGWLMVIPLVLLTSWLIDHFFGDQGGSNPLLELVLRSSDPTALFLLVITTVVLAPLFEEFVFRGVLLPVLAETLGFTWGVIVSAFVFAVAHLSVGELAPLMVLGLGLALLRLTSARLFPCVLMHALWNGVTFTNLVLLRT